MYVFASSLDYQKQNYPLAALLFEHHRKRRRSGITRALEIVFGT
jgi:hypothetical protein